MNRDTGYKLKSQTWRSFFFEWRRKQPKLKRWQNQWFKENDTTVPNQEEADVNDASQSD